MSRSLTDDYLCILRRAYRDRNIAYYASNSSEPARSAMSNTELAISPYVLRTYRGVVGPRERAAHATSATTTLPKVEVTKI